MLAWCGIACVTTLLRTPWRERLFRPRPLAVARPQDAGRVDALVRVVASAANHHVKAVTCLERSLVLQWLLRRQGCPAELRIGVRPDIAGLDAHAWVEIDGEPVNDRRDIAQAFAPLVAHPCVEAFGP